MPGKKPPACLTSLEQTFRAWKQIVFAREHRAQCSGRSRHKTVQVSQIHLFSCGFRCTCARMVGEDLSACVRSVAPKILAGGLFFFVRSRPPRVSADSGHVDVQVSPIHLFSCGFCCTCARMAGEDLSACVRSLAPKILAGGLFVFLRSLPPPKKRE